MKKLSIFWLSAVVLFAACQSNENSTSQSQGESIAQFASYGVPIEAEDANAINTLPTLLEGKDSAVVKVVGEIEKTCAVSGCWMTVKNELGESIRVTFKDYGFFVPTSGQEGKKTVFEGVARMETVSVDEQKHFAEDAGKSEEELAMITEPVTVMSFEASGVLIESEEIQN